VSDIDHLIYVPHNESVEVRWTKSTRKHRIGRAHALHVMARTTPIQDGDRLIREGPDDRGVELEIVAIVLDEDSLLVIHVMPSRYRRRGRR
jgi:hypothetical protein